MRKRKPRIKRQISHAKFVKGFQGLSNELPSGGFPHLHIMKTKIATVVVAALAVISISLAQTSQETEKMPTTTLQELHADLKKTRAELQHALTRIAALEQRVG